ncbi:MAG: tryptophan synthase subunit alpha [Bacteroidales bacterium]|nr:tryptophan synthase subunit alpha [Bacteroidales bacterium]
MNKLDKLFQQKPGNILSVYFTAGFPSLNDTGDIVQALQESGADIVEIGMPFSDPMADGPVIQKSNQQALDNGMSLKKLFEQLAALKPKVSIPIVLMGYLNPVMQYGIENFCRSCAETGVDGLILPDLPIELYLEEYSQAFNESSLRNIFLISPQTSNERIKLIDQHSNSFIYMVSSTSITGAKQGISQEQTDYFKRVQNMKLKNPRLIGFGISNNQSFAQACEYAHGAIIGSAFIRALNNGESPVVSTKKFVKQVLGK